MTEYELRDLQLSINSNITELVALFISIFAAYLICLYMVGNKLNKFQCIGISFIYSLNLIPGINQNEL